MMVYFAKGTTAVEASWWNAGWRYRQRIAIEYSGADKLENYQVLINDVDTASLIASGKMQSNCDDIRFTGSDGVQYNYWIESGCNTSTTDIWVKVLKLASPGSELFMYYGNAGAVIGSDGNETFEVFDDFNGTAIGDEWTTYGDTGPWSIESGALKVADVDGSAYSYIVNNGKKYSSNETFIMESKVYFAGSSLWGGFTIFSDASSTQHHLDYNPGRYGDRATSTAQEAPEDPAVNNDTWYDAKFVYDASTLYFYNNGALAYEDPLTSTTEPLNGYTGIVSNYYYDYVLWDDFRVRKYASTEPIINTPSTEEESKEPILHLSFDEGYGTTVYNSASAQPPRDPVAYWKMDETSGTTVHDNTASRNDLTMFNMDGGTDHISAKHGYGLNFDYTDDYVCDDYDGDASCETNGDDDNPLWDFDDQVTVSAWTNFDHPNISNSGSVVGIGTWSTTWSNLSFYMKYHSPADKYYCIISGNGTTGVAVFAGDTTTDSNTWHNVACSYDGVTLKIYIDGELSNQATGSVTDIFNSTYPLRIGSYTYPNGDLANGDIDEVKLYDYALTADQIAAEYAHTNGMMVNMDETTDWVQGVNGTALDFDGSDDYVAIADDDAFSPVLEAITIEAWVYHDATDIEMIVNKWGNSGNYGYSFQIDTNDKLVFWVSQDGKNHNGGLVSNNSVSTGSWHHVAVVSDGTINKLFIDGMQDSITESWTTGIFNNTSDIFIGQRYSNDYRFDGKMDEIKIYPYARTASEIFSDYNSYKSEVGTSVGHGGPTPSQSSSEKPVLWYDFNQETGTSVYDQSGTGNHGLMTNMDVRVAYTLGKYGKSLAFDGNDYYISASSSSTLNFGTGDFSIGAWVRLDGTASNRIVNKFDPVLNSGTGWIFDVNNTIGGANAPGYVRFRMDDGTTNIDYAIDGEVDDGEWHHVGVTIDRDNSVGLKIYVDGILKGETDASGASLTLDNTEMFGVATIPVALGSYFDGNIDEIKVYNYVRTIEQVHEDMMGSPISYWKFDEGFGTTANDTMGNNNGTLTNMDVATDWVAGKFGKALDFDGTDDVVVTGNMTPGSSGSLSTWVYLGGNGPTPSPYIQNIFDWATTPTSSEAFRLYWYGVGTGQDNRFNFQTAKSSTAYQLFSIKTYPAGAWYHVLISWDSSGKKLYVNGELDNSDATVHNFSLSTTLRIGRQYSYWVPTWHYPFYGIIDEPKIYNYALSEDQIKAEYNSPAGNPSFNGTTTRYGGTDVTSIGLTMPEPTTYWNFDDNSGTSSQDVSTSGNTGTLTNMDANTDWIRGIYGSALDFDGSNDYVISANTVALTSDFTISFWMNINNLYNYGEPVSLRNPIDERFLSFVTYADGHMLFNLGDGTNWGNGVTTSAATFQADRWYHIIGKRSGSTITLYIDGKYYGEATNSYGPTGELLVGVRRASSILYPFNGKIDEVKIYDESLSPAQIAWEYSKGRPVLHLKADQLEFFDCDGSGTGTATVCEDMNGFHMSANGSMTDSDWVTGKFGNALDFDGTDDYVRYSSWDYDLKDRFTVAAWVKSPDFSTQQYVVEFLYGKPLLAVNGYDVVVSLRNSGDTTWNAYASNVNCLTNGEWNHIAATYTDDDTLQLYCNGEQVYSGSHTGYIGGAAPTTLDIGGRSTVWFNGQIDDVRVYNYPRTAEQMKQDYQNGTVIRFD